MSITKSYNKYTDTYYAYDTTYEWDEDKQKKVQKKVCIGHYDSLTGELLPNSKRGRPAKSICCNMSDNPISASLPSDNTDKADNQIEMILSEMSEIKQRIDSLEKRMDYLLDRIIEITYFSTKE